jgi:hypothetical protein
MFTEWTEEDDGDANPREKKSTDLIERIENGDWLKVRWWTEDKNQDFSGFVGYIVEAWRIFVV